MADEREDCGMNIHVCQMTTRCNKCGAKVLIGETVLIRRRYPEVVVWCVDCGNEEE